MWRVLLLVQTALLFTAGVHHVVWLERPSFLLLLPQATTPEETTIAMDSEPMNETNASALAIFQPQPPQSCGNGFFFTRRTLTGPPVVVSVQREASTRSMSPAPPISLHRVPSRSSILVIPSKPEGQKLCISETFTACGLNLSTVPRMGDLLSNGSFVPMSANRNTGENAMPDPEVYRRYFLAFECAGFYKPEGDPYASAGKWEEKALVVMHAHPVLTPLHGGVSPARLIGQGRYLLKIAGATSILKILNTNPNENSTATAAAVLNGSTFNIVELGCGHAALLASMCPPVKGVNCYGSDFSPKLIEVGRQYFPWMHLEAHTKAPAVPTGWANLSVSHGVLLCLRLEDVCDHILEGLRVLRPGGKFVLWTLWATPFGSATRLHPGFFVSGVPWDNITAEGYEANITDETNSSEGPTFLPYCSNKIGSLVDRVDLWLADESASIYPPRLNRGGPYGVVLRRSSAAVGQTTREKRAPVSRQKQDNPIDSVRQQLLQFFYPPATTQTPTATPTPTPTPSSVEAQSTTSPPERRVPDAFKSPNSTAAYFDWYRRYSTLRRYDKKRREWVG